jgi:nitrogen fixation protein NifU and related proteins
MIMHDRLKEAADELQAVILGDAEETYSPEVIERWQNPRNWGQMENPDGICRVTGPCGETMQIALKVEGGRLRDVRFITDGCATSIASGSMATELAQGRTIEEAHDITPEMIFDGVGGLPEESEHCAILAASVLRAAIDNYLESKKAKE